MTIHPLCGFDLLGVNVDVYRLPDAAPYDLRLSVDNSLLKALRLANRRADVLAQLKAYEKHQGAKMQRTITTPPARVERVVNMEGALFLLRLALPEVGAFNVGFKRLVLGYRSVFEAVVLPTLSQAEKVEAFRQLSAMPGMAGNDR